MKNYIIGGLVVALVASLGLFFVEKERPLGAVSGPDLNSEYWSVNDVRMDYRRAGMKTATTTVCSIKSPSATSTLFHALAQFVVSSSTASTVVFAKDTGFTGSTTPLNDFSVSANAQATVSLLATTTATGKANLTFAPNTYFNITMTGGTGTFSPSGYCEAVFHTAI